MGIDLTGLEALKADDYRFGQCQVLRYDRHSPFFPPDQLSRLWHLCQQSRILEPLFCGMTDLSCTAIVNYLATRPILLIPGIWTSPDRFEEQGLGFTNAIMGTKPWQKAAFAGYGLFRPVWGKPEAEILGMLGLAQLIFQQELIAIMGIRYPWGEQTARFTHRLGFKDNGEIPRYMEYKGRLVSAICSTLLIEDFAEFVNKRLVELLVTGEVDGRRGRKIEQSQSRD